jgi:hypothetical protein
MPEVDKFKAWIDYFSGFLSIPQIIIGGLILLAGYLLLFRIEKIYQLSAFINGLFASISTKRSKASIENKLTGDILEVSKKLHKEIDEFLPYKLKINWIKKSDKKSFLDGDEVVVCMDHKRTENQNLVLGINDYISEGLLAGAKVHIDESILKSSKLVLTRKLLKSTYEKGFNYFIDNIFHNEIKDDPQIKDITEKLIELDRSGMFVQILLREYHYCSNQYVVGMPKNNDFIRETREFALFLHKIVKSNPNESVPLIFNKKYFKVSIGLIADKVTFSKRGEEFYVSKFNQALERNVNSIYLCSRGEVCIDITKEVKSRIDEIHEDLPDPKIYEYNIEFGKGNNRGLVIAYNI